MGAAPFCSKTRPSTARFVSPCSLSRLFRMSASLRLVCPRWPESTQATPCLEVAELDELPAPDLQREGRAGVAMRASFVAPNARLSSTITTNSTTRPTTSEIVRRLGPEFGLIFIFWVLNTSVITPAERMVPTTLLLNSSSLRKRSFPPPNPPRRPRRNRF